MIGCRRRKRQIQSARRQAEPDTWRRLLYTYGLVDELNNTVAKYRHQADELEEFLSICPAAVVVWRPGANRWSILEITAHLADAELLASARIRRIITQDRPEMCGYKQELWAQNLAYARQKIETVSARFILLRRENAGLLEIIPGEVWRLKGRHDEYGELSLRELIEDYIAHTAKHLDQMRSVAVKFETPNSKPQD
ncbi:MAG: DinB family protein [Blastocatellales bacterium]